MVKIVFSDISDCVYSQSLIDDFVDERKEYINSITDIKRKLQSAYVWKLLKYLFSQFDLSDDHCFCQDGCWKSGNGFIHFSLSHSNNIVCVAFSNEGTVGIDVEQISDKILKLKNKYNLCDDCSSLQEHLTLLWTQDESSFKAPGKSSFTYKKVFDKEGNCYIITVCSDFIVDDFESIDILKL